MMQKITNRGAHHFVICSLCPTLFSRGMTRVRKMVMFHFCFRCRSTRKTECNDFMVKVA